MAEHEMMVADLPNGVTIIVAHPGQQASSDPKYLRENFGITPDMVIPHSASRQARHTAKLAPKTS